MTLKGFTTIAILWFTLVLGTNYPKADELDSDCKDPKRKTEPITSQEIIKAHSNYLKKRPRPPKPPDFSFVVIDNGEFSGADLRGVNLRGAKLHNANFADAKLHKADFSCADLLYSNFSNAKLLDANIAGANLNSADFKGADLYRVNLSNTILFDTSLAETDLRLAKLFKAEFQPTDLPEGIRLSGIQGLHTLRLNSKTPNPASLQQLRVLLKDAGLRPSERDVTFAIEVIKDNDLKKGNIWDKLLMGVRIMFLKIPTQYGRSPLRALGMVAVMALLGTICNLLFIWDTSRNSLRLDSLGSINRIETKYVGTSADAAPWHNVVSPLQFPGFWRSLGWAVYVSILSSVAFGLRDMNLGQWIERVQASPFQLISMGWARVASGIQAIICLYLLSIWLVTLFGRPFT